MALALHTALPAASIKRLAARWLAAAAAAAAATEACTHPCAPPSPAVSAQEDGEIIGGLFAGDLLDSKGVVMVSKLPTKQELMQQTAIMLKKMPATIAQRLKAADATRLARVIKEANGQKLGRAVSMMKEKLPEA